MKKSRQDPYVKALEELQTLGVTVFPIFTKEEIILLRAEMMEMVWSYPEFKTSSSHPVMGGFGAHATPSSYHHPIVQVVRTEVFNRFNRHVIPRLAQEKGFSHWHMLFDRVCTRGPETSQVTAEAWHYDKCDDSANSNLAEKQLTGGWVNLNVDEPQFFCGLRGVFGTDFADGTKFRPIPETYHPELEDRLTAQKKIIVPPGHLICFLPELAHKVNPGKTKFLDLRLYLGTVMMNEAVPLYNFGRREIISNQLGFTGSGQVPPMYPAQSWMFHPDLIEAWTTKMNPDQKYLETRTVKGVGRFNGRTFTVIKRFIREPVRKYPYTEKRLRIMLPMEVE